MTHSDDGKGLHHQQLNIILLIAMGLTSPTKHIVNIYIFEDIEIFKWQWRIVYVKEEIKTRNLWNLPLAK